jgi:hypothetical protein
MLFGRRMKVVMRVAGVTRWTAKFGGLTVSIAYDERLRLMPFHVQIDAWTKLGVLVRDFATRQAAIAWLEGRLLGVVQRVPLDSIARVHPEVHGWGEV